MGKIPEGIPIAMACGWHESRTLHGICYAALPRFLLEESVHG